MIINQIPQVSVGELARRLESGARLVDVRELDEFVAGHVPGAIHLPLSEWPDAAGAIPAGQVHVICAKGGRSQKAAEYLAARGLDAVNIDGGTMSWVDHGLPIETGEGLGRDA
jgi:rhodanese-related sulfurtransferase